MTNESLKAAGDQLNNDLISQVLTATESKSEKASVTPPSDNLVYLPGGFITPAGEVIKTAEVRELTGKDEEAIGRAGTIGRAFNTILSRAVTKLGGETVDDRILDTLLAGDRDALLLGIYKATFGNEAELASYCNGCEDFKIVAIDVNRDIPVKVLVDPIEDRTFTVQGRSHTYLVTLPNGALQRDLAANEDKNVAEQLTALFENTILEIDDSPVVSKLQVHNMGVVDRRKVADEITKRASGPEFAPINVTCPDCEGEVVVPINLGALFRF